MSAHFFGMSSDFAHPVIGRHIVDVIAAVEVIETLICGEIFAIVAKVPLSDARRVVADRFQRFGNGDFVAQNTVHVV